MTLRLSIGHASRPVASERVCGDQLAVVTDGARATIVVADGLGHGPAAEAAALLAIEHVRKAGTATVSDLLRGCHEALRGTRGAAVTILSIDPARGELIHAGIGNVELATLSREPIRPIALPGIVGARMRKVVESAHRVHAGDLIVVFTDGISSRLSLERYRTGEPQPIADDLLARHAKAHDDAACVVVRVRST